MSVENDALYELVLEAVRAALREREGGEDVPLARRMTEGLVLFRDGEDTPVKDQKNLVTVIPGKGARVIALSRAELTEVYDLRILLETDLLLQQYL